MIDLREISTSTSRYNFHTHTQYCDGRDTIENFVKHAVDAGFKHLGFSPHSPVIVESPCNMKIEDVEKYLNEMNHLKSVYCDRIHLYAAMEIDYFDNWGPSNVFFVSLPLDYRIGSIHFIPSFVNEEEYVDIDGNFESFRNKMNLHFNNDIRGVVESYYKQSLKMIEAGGFDIIGHFDKIGYNASLFQRGIDEEEWYLKLVRNVFDAILDKDYIIEINTKAYEQFNRFFPSERLFTWIKQYKPHVLINSDSHFPHLLNSGRESAMHILNNI